MQNWDGGSIRSFIDEGSDIHLDTFAYHFSTDMRFSQGPTFECCECSLQKGLQATRTILGPITSCIPQLQTELGPAEIAI